VRIRPDLQKAFLFSVPYSHEATVGVVRKDDLSMQNVGDLKGRIVAVVAASFQEDYAKRMGGYRELLSLPTGADVFLALHTGHADVAMTGLTSATHYVRRGYPARIVAEGAVLNAQGIVMGKKSVDLKAAIDSIIERRQADGTYAELYRKHFHLEPPQPG
jgi:ABC-type amino acid transport substrate-binding protein